MLLILLLLPLELQHIHQCVAINAERFVVSLICADSIVSGYYQKNAHLGSDCIWSTGLHVLACVII